MGTRIKANRRRKRKVRKIDETGKPPFSAKGFTMPDGQKNVMWVSNDLPAEIAEQFMHRVIQIETQHKNAKRTTLWKKLSCLGLDLLPPEQLDDSSLGVKLQELVNHLAGIRRFLEHTDHLSDRELYKKLYLEILPKKIEDAPYSANDWIMISTISGNSREERHIHLLYYASEEERINWAKDNPAEELPSLQAPPYDRDRYLPGPYTAVPSVLPTFTVSPVSNFQFK